MNPFHRRLKQIAMSLAENYCHAAVEKYNTLIFLARTHSIQLTWFLS